VAAVVDGTAIVDHDGDQSSGDYVPHHLEVDVK
jgi:hypothetical protein